MTNSHKNITTRAVVTFAEVFPEESFENTHPDVVGDIDNYRASWEQHPAMPRKGRIVTDDTAMYDPDPYADWN